MATHRPNFFVIGAAKAGTSALCNYLGQHPEIYVSPIKEPHFFSYDEKLTYSNGPGDKKRMQDATGTLEDYLRLFQKVGAERMVGEGSTTYLDSENAAQRIAEFSPNARIVLVLRDAAERAFASYTHLRRDGNESISDFRDALAMEEKRIQACWSVLWHYRSRQFSYEKVQRFYTHFPQDQMHVIEYEQWKQDNLGALKEIFGFLGVDENFEADVSRRANLGGIPKSEAVHRFVTRGNPIKSIGKLFVPVRLRTSIRTFVNRRNLQRTRLAEETREELVNCFREDTERLQDLVGLDLSHWLR